jgi:hypothetical protein
MFTCPRTTSTWRPPDRTARSNAAAGGRPGVGSRPCRCRRARSLPGRVSASSRASAERPVRPPLGIVGRLPDAGHHAAVGEGYRQFLTNRLPPRPRRVAIASSSNSTASSAVPRTTGPGLCGADCDRSHRPDRPGTRRSASARRAAASASSGRWIVHASLLYASSVSATRTGSSRSACCEDPPPGGRQPPGVIPPPSHARRPRDPRGQDHSTCPGTGRMMNETRRRQPSSVAAPRTCMECSPPGGQQAGFECVPGQFVGEHHRIGPHLDEADGLRRRDVLLPPGMQPIQQRALCPGRVDGDQLQEFDRGHREVGRPGPHHFGHGAGEPPSRVDELGHEERVATRRLEDLFGCRTVTSLATASRRAARSSMWSTESAGARHERRCAG